MTEFKGTKGKWVLNGSRPHSKDGENHGTFDIVSDINTNVQIVGVPAYTFYGLNIETAEANAKLIACAPEMLEMLDVSVNLLRQTTEFEVLEIFRKSVSDIELLIKKATE